jgi:hypothetical protein
MGIASGIVAGSIESVVDPPAIPSLSLPPFFGVAALADLPKSTGDTAAIKPKADTRAINSRRESLPSVNKRSSSFSSDILAPPFDLGVCDFHAYAKKERLLYVYRLFQ